MKSVNYLTQSVCYIHWSNRERNKMHLDKIPNTVSVLKSLFNDEM